MRLQGHIPLGSPPTHWSSICSWCWPCRGTIRRAWWESYSWRSLADTLRLAWRICWWCGDTAGEAYSDQTVFHSYSNARHLCIYNLYIKILKDICAWYQTCFIYSCIIHCMILYDSRVIDIFFFWPYNACDINWNEVIWTEFHIREGFEIKFYFVYRLTIILC